MGYMRHNFPFDTVGGDTGPKTDTGAHFFGEVMQMRWIAEHADTGLDLHIDLIHVLVDTGDAYRFYSETAVGNNDITRVPSQVQHGSDGAALAADTGARVGVPVVSAGERLRVTVAPGDTGGVRGRMYVWTKGEY